jgi:hypothetical protein
MFVMLLKKGEIYSGNLSTLQMQDCWIEEISLYPEGPATGHLDTRFLGFPPSSNKC